MGYSKIVKISDRKVRIEHQLNNDGTPYAEDVTLEIADSVNPSRLSYLVDGSIGILSYSFTPVAEIVGLRFPSDKE